MFVFTVTLALLLRIRVIEESLPVVSPGHAAEFDPLQSVLQKYSAVHAQRTGSQPSQSRSRWCRTPGTRHPQRTCNLRINYKP